MQQPLAETFIYTDISQNVGSSSGTKITQTVMNDRVQYAELNHKLMSEHIISEHTNTIISTTQNFDDYSTGELEKPH